LKRSILINGQDIETYLQALDASLAGRLLKMPVRIAVVGGVYMMFFLQNRASTKDVDVVPLDFPDTTHPSKETKAFRSATNAVAKMYRLPRNWMSDVVAAFIPDLGPLTLWKSYEHLQVYVPSADYILTLKLLAGRERDEDDILALLQFLHIETREQAQAIVDRYADQKWQRECCLDDTLDALF